VDERHEDRERRPAEEAGLPDDVRHLRIMNGGCSLAKRRVIAEEALDASPEPAPEGAAA
jgi:hypothetical protein